MSKIIDYCVTKVSYFEGYQDGGKIKNLITQGWVPFGGLGGGNNDYALQSWIKYDTDSIKEALDKLAKAEEEKNEAEENVEEAMEKVRDAEEILTTTMNELDMWKKRALTAEVALNESYETKDIWKQRALKAEEDYKCCLETKNIKKE